MLVPSPAARLASLAFIAILIAGCSTSDVTHIRRFSDTTYPPRNSNYPIEVFKDRTPSRAYTPIAKLSVHIEKSYFRGSALEEVMPDLKDLAREAGADAIIDIDDRGGWYAETRRYHVTAIAIRYND